MRICRICKEEKLLNEFYSQIMKLASGPKRMYRTECKKCTDKTSRKYHQNHRDRMILDNSRREDKRNNLKTEITREQICELINKPCHYCGETCIPIGIDRVDNNKGHTNNNIVSCCIRCNSLKSDMPTQAWMKLVPTVRRIRELGFFEQWVGHNLGSRKLGIRHR